MPDPVLDSRQANNVVGAIQKIRFYPYAHSDREGGRLA